MISYLDTHFTATVPMVLYRFGFNGKENDNELYGANGSFQDYGMRMYDTRVARFVSVDPITAKYPELTPYQFASNTPIMGVDLDGLEIFVMIDATGNGQVGHAMIAVQNYKFDEANNAYIKDGYTIYQNNSELYPNSSWVVSGSKSGIQKTKGSGTLTADLLKKAFPYFEGIVQIHGNQEKSKYTDAETTQERKLHMGISEIANVKKDASFDIYGYNCTQFVSDALASIGIKGLTGSQIGYVKDWYNKEKDVVQDIYSPNDAFLDLKEKNTYMILKGVSLDWSRLKDLFPDTRD